MKMRGNHYIGFSVTAAVRASLHPRLIAGLDRWIGDHV